MTLSGRQLYQLSEDLIRKSHATQEAIRSGTSMMTTQLRVGTFSSIALYLWPSILGELKSDPNIKLNIRTGGSRDILEALLQRDVDVSITVEASATAPLIRHELYSDRYAFYCRRPGIQSKALPDTPLFYMPDASDRDGKSLRQFVSSSGVRFSSLCEMDSFDVITGLVEQGHGVGILPTRVARSGKQGLKKLKLGELDLEFGEHRFYLSYRKDLDLPQKILDRLLLAANVAVKKLNG
jgi:DNA-binding transcriptional LysR family regulator